MKKICSILLCFIMIFSAFTVSASAAGKKTVTAKASGTSYVYNGKSQKPSVKITYKGKKLTVKKNYTVTYPKSSKNVGKYAVKIKYKGSYTGKTKLYYTINPKKVSLYKITAGQTTLNVNWNKAKSQTTGYQVRYSSSSKFKNAKYLTVKSIKTAKATIKSLKPNTNYYVSIRAYKTVNGKKFYSAWSKALKKKTLTAVKFTDKEVKDITNRIISSSLFGLSPVGGERENLFQTELSKISPEGIIRFMNMYGGDTFLKKYIKENGFYDYSLIISNNELNKYASYVFGRTCDFKAIGPKSDEYDNLYYDEKAGKIVYEFGGGYGFGPIDDYEYESHTVKGTDTAIVTLKFVIVDGETGDVIRIDHRGTLTIKKLDKEGIWQIVSFKKGK